MSLWTRGSEVERFIHIEEVRGSIPLGSTSSVLNENICESIPGIFSLYIDILFFRGNLYETYGGR
jgi:hypothetical protein